MTCLMMLQPYGLIDRLIDDNLDDMLRFWPLDDY